MSDDDEKVVPVDDLFELADYLRQYAGDIFVRYHGASVALSALPAKAAIDFTLVCVERWLALDLGHLLHRQGVPANLRPGVRKGAPHQQFPGYVRHKATNA